MEDNTLTEMAMLAPDSEAGAELAEDFRRLRQRIDRVVRSPIAGGTPPDGPIHAEEHTVLLPEECGADDGDTTEQSREILLGGSARYEEPYITVPRIVGA